MTTKSIAPMTKADFLELVTKNQGGTWVAGPEVARELGLHLSEEELVHGWLVYEEKCGHDKQVLHRESHVVTDRHYLITSFSQRDERLSYGGHKRTVAVESAPIGRLRAVSTNEFLNDDNGPVGGGFTLHFAGPVFSGSYGGSRDDLYFAKDRDWPSPEVQAFLSAIATVRR